MEGQEQKLSKGQRRRINEQVRKQIAADEKERQWVKLSTMSHDPHKKYTRLELNDDQKKHRKYLAEIPQEERRNTFNVFIDGENTANDLGVPLDCEEIKRKTAATLRRIYRNNDIKVRHITIIGNRKAIFGEAQPVETCDLTFQDVFHRKTICAICKKTFRDACYLRPTEPYERKTDVADSEIEDAMTECYFCYGAPWNMLLMTADGDFTNYVNTVSRLGIHVYLAMPEHCNAMLKAAVLPSRRFDLSKIVNA